MIIGIPKEIKNNKANVPKSLSLALMLNLSMKWMALYIGA